MKHYKKKLFLNQISEVPIVSSVCKNLNISRQTYYRWRDEDEEFLKAVDLKLNVGRESINDLAEGTIINAMKSGDVGAAKFWLHNNKQNYIQPRSKNYILNPADLKKKGNVITFVDFSGGEHFEDEENKKNDQ